MFNLNNINTGSSFSNKQHELQRQYWIPNNTIRSNNKEVWPKLHN